MKRALLLIALIVVCLILPACISQPLALPTPVRRTGQYISSIRLHDGDIYFGAGYCLYHLEPSERALHKVLCRENWTFYRPAIAEHRVYVQVLTQPGGERSLVAIDQSTNTVLWQADESTQHSPYLGSIKGEMLVLSDRVVAVREEQGESEQRLCAFGTESGELIWCTEPNHFHASSLVLQDDLIWSIVSRSTDNDENGMFVAIDASSGQIRQTIDVRPHVRPSGLLYLDDQWVLGVQNAGRYTVFAIDQEQPGQLAWSSDSVYVGVDQVARRGEAFLVRGGPVYGNHETASAIDVETGNLQWTFDPDEEYALTQVGEQIVLFMLYTEECKTVFALDASSGLPVWEYTLDACNLASEHASWYGPHNLVVVEGTVYVPNKNTMDALDVNTGELLWQVDIDSDYEYYSPSF